MKNINFYNPELHQVIKNQQDVINIRILPNANEGDREDAHTEFTIGDIQIKADTDADCLVNYLLEPLLEHHHLPVTIDGKPIERLPFKPRASTSYMTTPRPLEGNHHDRHDDFSGRRDAGIIIDGIKYLPDHAQWTYRILDRHSPHPHWTGLTRISVYPLVDLGSPPHSDPSHPENIAEALSRTISPEYQVPEWMRQVHCPDPSKLYESWTPPAARDENTPDWALQPVTIAVNGTPVLIDVTDHALAFSIAHALYDQPELGLVPVGNVKEGQPYATVTCPQPGNIAIVTSQAAQECRTTDRQPDPDGPVESIQIPCSVDGQDITVRTNFLFAQRPDRHGSNTPAIYATGRHKTIDPERGDTEPVSLMAANAYFEDKYSKAPSRYRLRAIQALEGTEKAIRTLMLMQIGQLQQEAKDLSPHHGKLQVEGGPWSVAYDDTE